MIYVTLPPYFVAIKYPGYFWHTKKEKLYSIKIGGELRPLKKQKFYVDWRYPYRSEMADLPCYRVSIKGCRKTIFEADLKKLVPEESQITVMV